MSDEPYTFAGKVIGRLTADGTLVQNRGSDHLLRSVQGFALASLVVHDPRVVRVETHWKGRTYTVTTAYWKRHGKPWRNGAERQLALPLVAMVGKDASQETLEI